MSSLWRGRFRLWDDVQCDQGPGYDDGLQRSRHDPPWSYKHQNSRSNRSFEIKSCNFHTSQLKVKASNNYLALRNQTGHYYLNGNWRIDYPQQFEAAGMLQSTTYWIHVSKIRSSLDPCLKIRCTLDPCLKTITHWISLTGTTFHYERKYKNSKARGPLTLFAPESIRALGPTTEALFIVVCIQHHSSSMLFPARHSKLLGVVPRRKSGRRVWIFLEERCHERDSIRWTRTHLNLRWIGI